jgi:lipopolysaccharide/colanic/teichoic acid biosynthesis glycosyltransferase
MIFGAEGTTGRGCSWCYALLKRLADVAVAACLMIGLAPLLLAIAFLVRAWLGSPVLFRQMRPGLKGRPFTIFKFRTMTVSHDSGGVFLPDERRMTSFGGFLRRWSLDELPELWNVLRGEMSLVGPRPLLMQYLPLYTAEQARRHSVRPGVTGLAQVRGRNSLSWEEKFALDVWYVENLSLALDIRVLFETIGQVLGGRAVSHAGHATMPLFRGGPGGTRESKDE